MKKITGVIILALLLSAPGFAQNRKDEPGTEPKEKSGKKQNASKADQNGANLLESGTAIEAELRQTLDVKNLSVGDQVVLETTRSLRQNGQVVVQKGARLIGRVTEVRQKTKADAQSRLGVVFERIEGKNLSAPLSATIVALVQANAGASVGDTLDSGITGGATASGATRATSGGGLLGGVTNTVGAVVGTTTGAVGGVTNTAGQTLGGTTQTLGRTLNGIRIAPSADAAAGGATTLSATNKNLRIEKGVTFQLRLTEAIEN